MSHFNVSLTVWAKSRDSVHKPPVLKRKDSRSGLNQGPSAYQPSALPLGHTGSHHLINGRFIFYSPPIFYSPSLISSPDIKSVQILTIPVHLNQKYPTHTQNNPIFYHNNSVRSLPKARGAWHHCPQILTAACLEKQQQTNKTTIFYTSSAKLRC